MFEKFILIKSKPCPLSEVKKLKTDISDLPHRKLGEEGVWGFMSRIGLKKKKQKMFIKIAITCQSIVIKNIIIY